MMAENLNVDHGDDVFESDYDPDYLEHVIKMDRGLKNEFFKIIGGQPKTIPSLEMHEKAAVEPNGDLGIFYRYFSTKYVSIRLMEDAKSGMLDNHASIFPFQTNRSLPVCDMPELDIKFSSAIKEFVEKHFSQNVDIKNLKNLFWTNVSNFKNNHFPNAPSLDQLARIIEIGSSWRNRQPPPECDYLKNFIRLNDDGIKWYRNFQSKFNEACKVYEKDLILPEKGDSYFKYLPEINCCELLLLLETRFYESNSEKYVRLFKKYLFFFKNAIEREENPVCFIDDTLFACLQFKKDYETFREDKSIYDCQWELWMMTLVHRRKHATFSNQKINLQPDRNNLEILVTYMDTLPLESPKPAIVYHGEPKYPRFKVFLLLHDSVFLINYRRKEKEHFEGLIGQILKSALLSREIKELKYYNAYSSKETTFEMPQTKDEIRRFIHQLTVRERNENRLEPLYPLKFLLTPEVRKYFAKLPAIPRYRN